MREAMEIYKSWLNQYNKEKENNKSKKKNNKERDGNKENTANTTKVENRHTQSKRKVAVMVKTEGGDDNGYNGDIRNEKSSKRIKQQKLNNNRSELEVEYKTTFNISLPKVAKEEKWPIRLNHCLMRVALDAY